jgi:VanZ family protein
MIFSICAIYAIADEFHQKFVYGRGASIVDTLVDICGCFIGILSILLLGNLRNRIRSFKGQKIINGK